jgi:glutamate-1-semialdehyde 2,1-aminomutase
MTTMKTTNSEAYFERAKQIIPGGVNSPVRAFRSVGGVPRFIEWGEGAHIWDADGNRYLDYVLSWGPLVLGHAHAKVVEALHEAIMRGTSYGAPTALENELAQLVIDTVPSIEMIRFVNSGTEATMSALRLARAYTGRDKIVKFAGCYHGHADMLLVQAGSGVATLGLPDSPGVPASTTANTLTAEYNDLEAMRGLFEQHPDAIAAVIVEPIAANMGFVMPQAGFLQGLQDLCHEYGALLILDEVMTGFRVSEGGAQKAWGLDPDITCLGKVIGGGLPVGAYAGKREIMQMVAPAGSMYQAGTLSGNPLAMTAGLATIRALLEANVQTSLEQRTAQLVEGIREAAQTAKIPMQVDHAGSMFGFYFLKEAGMTITDYASTKRYADTERYKRFFHAMLEAGFYFAPSQFEAGFMSTAHRETDIQATIEAVEAVLAGV